MNEIVVQKILEGKNGRILRLIFNRPDQLNALSHEMLSPIKEGLEKAENDERIKCVVFEGINDKVFCAGGDIKQIYEFIIKDRLESADSFFELEYKLNAFIASFSKPSIALTPGLVMGGGAGIMQDCRFKVVSEKTRFAMPETKIGFYPDVGAGFFLNHIPRHFGIFAALTGSMLNAADLIHIGLADRIIPSSEFSLLHRKLSQLDWSEDSKENEKQIFDLLKTNENRGMLPESALKQNEDKIFETVDFFDLENIIQKFRELDEKIPFLKQAKENINYASPLSLSVTFRLLKKFKTLSLEEVLDREVFLSKKFMRNGEFREGVRALLIDKDMNPDWAYKSTVLIPEETLEKVFDSKL